VRRELRLFDLVLFNTAAVVGFRNLPLTAQTGLGSVTLWIAGALLFFVPLALVVAGLSRRMPAEGGIYVWTREAFGAWHGFLCGVSYVISILFLLPTLLLSGLTMAAVAFGFAQDKWFLVSLSLVILWGVLAANLVGLGVGKWVSDFGGIATGGVGLLLLAAGFAAWQRSGLATSGSLVPRLNWSQLNFWSQIALAYTGVELGSVMAEEIRDPERTIARAAWMSALVICAVYVGGTLSLLALLPADRIDIISGLVQAGQTAGTHFGWHGFSIAMAILILTASAGAFGSWLSGCARLPFVIGVDKYLPPAFARLHPRWGTPHLALFAEGLLCTLFLLVLTLGENLRAVYQILVDLTTVTTLFPFLYLFAAGWKSGFRLSAVCGLAVTALSIVMAFVPPEGAASWRHEAKLIGGCAAVVWAARINFKYAVSRKQIHDSTQRGRQALWPQNPF
jgi:amino acid transporter